MDPYANRHAENTLNSTAPTPARIPASAIKRRMLVLAGPHSGGSLVRRLLGGYPGVYDFGESGVFSELSGQPRRYRPWTMVGLSIGRERRRLGELLDRAYAECEADAPTLPPREARLRTAFAGTIATFDRVALASGCRSWVEHTPGLALQARPLERLIPRLRIVHVIRDGRDVVASHCAQTARQRGRYSRASDARYAIECWNSALAEHARCFGRSGHSFVFYEDLIHYPHRELTRLAHECGLNVETGATEAAVGKVDVAPPRAARSRFRELFDVAGRRRIEARLDLERYGALAERLHALRVDRYAFPAVEPAVSDMSTRGPATGNDVLR